MKHRENVGTEGFAIYLTYCGYKMADLDQMTDDEVTELYSKEVTDNGINIEANKSMHDYCIDFR